jgi:hypothetical protein
VISGASASERRSHSGRRPAALSRPDSGVLATPRANARLLLQMPRICNGTTGRYFAKKAAFQIVTERQGANLRFLPDNGLFIAK